MKTKFLIILILLGNILNAQYSKLVDFAGISNGMQPQSSLISDGTFLYGMTVKGGTEGVGVIFKIKSDGTSFTKLLDFSEILNGSYPNGALIYDGSFLYGMAAAGGLNGVGTIFKIKPDGTGFVKLLDFSGTSNGAAPVGSLFSDGTYLYGMTANGGVANDGVIFKIKPDGSGYIKLLDFTGTSNGSLALGSLISDGTYLYGTTAMGGAANHGVLFKIKPDGTGFTKLLDFSGTSNASDPQGSLIFDGIFFYGVTYTGGTNNEGVIFKIKSDGSGYANLFNFSRTSTGGQPQCSLFSDGTYLYGTTVDGGINDRGVVFKFKLNSNGYSKMLEFAGSSNGSQPYGSVISDGSFLYGMTNLGGVNDFGVLYKIGINDLVGLKENKMEGAISIFPNPCSTYLTLETNTNFIAAIVTLYNSAGQIIKETKNISGQTFNLQTSELANGFYFIEVSEEGKVITRKKVVIN